MGIFWQIADFKMNSKRKEYQRRWIANKGKTTLLKKACEQPELNRLSMSSGSSDDALNDPGQTVFVDSDSELSTLAGEPECHDVWNSIDNTCSLPDCLSSGSESDEDDDDIASQLRTWVVETGVTQVQLNKLLPILKKSHSDLPLTSATLMKTPTVVQCRSVSGGDYLYFGVKCGIQHILQTLPSSKVCSIDEVHLTFNIDGLPLFSSSSYSFWPILCCLSMLHRERFSSLLCMVGKPNPLTWSSSRIQSMN